jgi:hypothetical protein
MNTTQVAASNVDAQMRADLFFFGMPTDLFFCGIPGAWHWRQILSKQKCAKPRFCLKNAPLQPKRTHCPEKRPFVLKNAPCQPNWQKNTRCLEDAARECATDYEGSEAEDLEVPVQPCALALTVQDVCDNVWTNSAIQELDPDTKTLIKRKRGNYFAQKRRPVLLTSTVDLDGSVSVNPPKATAEDGLCPETSYACIAAADVQEDTSTVDARGPLAMASSLFTQKAKPDKWVWISLGKFQNPDQESDTDAEPSENSSDSEAEPVQEGFDTEFGVWVSYSSRSWRHPVHLREAPSAWPSSSQQLDAFLGEAAAVHEQVDKCSTEVAGAQPSRCKVKKFGKMLTEVYKDFRPHDRDVSINLHPRKEVAFHKFLQEQHQVRAILRECAARYEKHGCRSFVGASGAPHGGPCRCKSRQHLLLWWLDFCRTEYLAHDTEKVSLFEKHQSQHSFDKFVDAEFDNEHEEHIRAWNELMKDDEDEVPWFQRPRMTQHPDGYVPMPFRVQHADDDLSDRSNKQVKISNLSAEVHSDRLKKLFEKCCNGRFERVHVVGECGPECTLHRCSGKWMECEDFVCKGFAYITFFEHKHAKNAIDMFNRLSLDNLIIEVTWAKNKNTLESALEKSAAWARACGSVAASQTGADAVIDAHRSCSQPTIRTQQAHSNSVVRTSQVVASSRPIGLQASVPVDFRFQGRIQARSDGRRGKLTRGHIELSPNQLQLLHQHPSWQDNFDKSDVFWHRNECDDRATLSPGCVVTFTVSVGSSGVGMQAQHIQVER